MVNAMIGLTNYCRTRYLSTLIDVATVSLEILRQARERPPKDPSEDTGNNSTFGTTYALLSVVEGKVTPLHYCCYTQPLRLEIIKKLFLVFLRPAHTVSALYLFLPRSRGRQ